MIGRMAMQSPWMFRHVDEIFYGCKGPGLSRRQIVERYCDYVEKLQETHRMLFLNHFNVEKWKPKNDVIFRPLCTLFSGVPRGGAVFRGVLQDKLCIQKMPIRQAVMESLKCFDSEVLDEIDDYDPNKIDSYSVVIE